MGVIPGTENGDSIQSSLSETNQIQDHSMSITQYPDGYSAGLCSDIINQYGQLIGEYSRLDDELWISKPDEIDDDHGHDDMERNEQVLEYQPLSYEYPVQQEEQLSKSIQYPLPGEHTPCVNKTSSSLKDSPLDQSHTSSPVSVLRRRSYSSVKKKAPKQRARSENGRFAKSNLCEAFQSSPFDDIAGPILGKHPRTKKVSDLLQSSQTSSTPASSPEQGNSEKSSSWEWEPDPTPKPSTKKRKNHHPKTTVKKCMHCESTKTPQWREGPMGHGTLCNACGVKYKHGRLSQEYRPLKSPTFNPKLHSNIRPDAKKKEWKKRAKKCTRCESTPSPWWVGPMGGGEAAVSGAGGTQYGHDRISKDNRPSNPPSLDLCLDSIPEQQQSPRISMQDSIPEPQQQSPRISMQDFILEQQQQSPEVSMQDSIPEQQQSPRISIQDSIPQPTPEKKQRKTITKKQCIPQPTLEKKQRKTTTKKQCMHCESTKTPQWREGPMGVGTLCNACGVQYRFGRLFPEYRPLKSPTYNPALHSHLPKRVQQMRMNRNTDESAASRASSSQNL